MALASLPVCLWFREYYAVWGFLITALSSLLIGQLLYRSFQQLQDNLGSKQYYEILLLAQGQ
ncbi:MAG: hypothetical protein KME64_37845 [Scytonematopsis contorta HA4267-MV1]|nr:hypothetical protein [Scytonematopsis contorta HA4267-MV1]